MDTENKIIPITPKKTLEQVHQEYKDRLTTKIVDYKLFNEQLILIAIELRACEFVLKQITDVSSARDFQRAYERTVEQVAPYFGYELEDDNKIENLQDKINDRDFTIRSLENDLEDCQNRYPEIITGWDEQKARYFKELSGNYTESEFEELMKNGKQLLKKINSYDSANVN